MSHLTAQQLDELKTMLLAEKKDMEEHFKLEEVSDGSEGFKESISESAGELSSYDNHPADLGTETFERERDMALDALIEDKLQETEHSLIRMEKNEYGICEECGGEIPFERLLAIPYTSYCVEHTPAQDSSASRPVEEQVMTLPPAEAGQEGQSNNRFDDAGAWDTLESYGSSDSPIKTSDPSTEVEEDKIPAHKSASR
ncbi:TraR/DksA C4-type zinc finger protein [Paenibacillus sp. FSL H8-0034]|uniref:TraR/DksA C4-type zinc finger protein n=1 Tax=Paenibacillus sp. FSL H8-0034 TaxID=2954671 RepID=UPI0030F9B0D7